MLGDGKISQEALQVLVSAQDAGRRAGGQVQSHRIQRDRDLGPRRPIGEWLEDHGIEDAWDYASTFVEAGLDIDWLESIRVGDRGQRRHRCRSALGWLKYTIDTELLMCEIAEASKRISALLADAKQYSQMDRAPYQSANLHELLRSTFMMFGDRIGKDGTNASRWSRSTTRLFPNWSATQPI